MSELRSAGEVVAGQGSNGKKASSAEAGEVAQELSEASSACGDSRRISILLSVIAGDAVLYRIPGIKGLP